MKKFLLSIIFMLILSNINAQTRTQEIRSSLNRVGILKEMTLLENWEMPNLSFMALQMKLLNFTNDGMEYLNLIQFKYIELIFKAKINLNFTIIKQLFISYEEINRIIQFLNINIEDDNIKYTYKTSDGLIMENSKFNILLNFGSSNIYEFDNPFFYLINDKDDFINILNESLILFNQ